MVSQVKHPNILSLRKFSKSLNGTLVHILLLLSHRALLQVNGTMTICHELWLIFTAFVYGQCRPSWLQIFTITFHHVTPSQAWPDAVDSFQDRITFCYEFLLLLWSERLSQDSNELGLCKNSFLSVWNRNLKKFQEQFQSQQPRF
jgi:hypothetical protein